MHPDQSTPASHRYSAPDSASGAPSAADPQAPPAGRPEQEQAGEAAAQGGEPRTTEVRTPEPEGARLGEAGGAYTGRQMDDRLKTNPRVDDARDVEGDEAAG